MKNLLSTVCFLFTVMTIQGQNIGLEVDGPVKFNQLAGTGLRLNMSFPNGIQHTVSPGSPNQILIDTGNGIVWTDFQGWKLSGNAGTSGINNFIGTTDFQDLSFRTNNVKHLGITKGGLVHVGPAIGGTPIRFVVNTDENYSTGLYNTMKANGFSTRTAIRNIMNSAAGETGSLFGFDNVVYGDGDQTIRAINNWVQITGSGSKYGIDNFILDSPGLKVGILNSVGQTSNQIGVESGNIYGIQNIIKNTNSNLKVGTLNTIANTNGISYGVRNSIADSDTNVYAAFGTDNRVNLSGTGDAYGGYFDATSNGDAFAAVFNRGQVVVNQAGGDHDLRVETENNEYALLVDADKDLIRVGARNGDLAGNGAVNNGITQRYVADFDLGPGVTSGTTIGIGSNEYIVDGTYEIILNGRFSPINHITNNLGFSTTERAWDNVFADEFISVSDRREKKNINALEYGLDEILKLEPVTYKLNKDPYQDQKLGLIAQDVLAIIPEAVKTHTHDVLDEKDKSPTKTEMDRMGMNYQYLIPVLIKATQEQQELIEVQSQMIEELRKEIDEVKRS